MLTDLLRSIVKIVESALLSIANLYIFIPFKFSLSNLQTPHA